jgi:membrane protein
MVRKAQGAWEIVKQAAHDWFDDRAAEMGAALAFYSALSLAPLVIIALAMVSQVVEAHTARTQFLAQMQSLVGEEGAAAIEGLLKNAQQPSAGTRAAVLGLMTLLFGASGVFGQLQLAMNTIWNVPSKVSGGMWGIVRSRFLSFVMVLGMGGLLLVSLALSAAVAGVRRQVGAIWPGHEMLTQWSNEVVTFLVVTLLFAMTFKLLPDTRVAWRDACGGALLTAGLFTVGKWVTGLYLGYSAVGSVYGAAGSLVVLLVWIYYSAQILFFGAELTHAMARRGGRTSTEHRPYP